MGKPSDNIYDTNENFTTLTVVSSKYGEVVFLIDNDYVDLAKQYQWSVRKSINSSGFYLRGRKHGDKTYKQVMYHNLITGCDTKNQVVDHVNRNTLDNRLSNLQVTDNIGNARNHSLQKNNKTGYSAICISKNKYMVQIGVGNGKRIYKEFPLTDEGLQKAIKFRNEKYRELNYNENHGKGEK